MRHPISYHELDPDRCAVCKYAWREPDPECEGELFCTWFLPTMPKYGNWGYVDGAYNDMLADEEINAWGAWAFDKDTGRIVANMGICQFFERTLKLPALEEPKCQS